MNNHTRSCDHDNPQNAPEVVTTDTGKIRTGSSNGKIMVDTYYPMPVIDGADGAMLQLGYEKRRICGLKKRTFIIVAVVVAAVVIVAIAGGVAVGMKAGSNGNQDGKWVYGCR